MIQMRVGKKIKFRMYNLPEKVWNDYYVLSSDRQSVVFSSLPPRELQYQAEHVRYSRQAVKWGVEQGDIKA